MIIRPYQASDLSEVLNLLSSNIPTYFAPEEYEDLKTYLAHEIEDYYVVEQDNHIVAAGGINYKEQDAYISWDFVDANMHGTGIGKQLLQYRLDRILKRGKVKRIIVRTSQFAYGFYEKNGFVIKEQHKDYWAPGFDMIFMVYQEN